MREYIYWEDSWNEEKGGSEEGEKVLRNKTSRMYSEMLNNRNL